MTQGVKIKVTADSSQARSDFANLSKSVKNIEQRGEAMSKIFRGLAIGAGFMASFTVLTKAISRSSDAVIKLENSLKVVMPAGQNLKGMMQELRVVSEQTRAPIANVALTFNRLAMAMQNKVLTKDIVKVTKNIQMAAAISGATAEEANRAIRQLGQGLQGGVLRAEEYNSIIDGMPRLAKAIADGMGVPLDGLREAMLAGQLTSKVMFKAIRGETEKLKEEFMQTKATIDQITALMGDEFNRALEAIGDVTGITKFIRQDLMGLRTVFKFVADNARFFAASAQLEFLLFISETKTFFRKWQEAIGGYFSKLFGPMLDKLQPITTWVENTFEKTKALTTQLLLFISPIQKTIKDIFTFSEKFLSAIAAANFDKLSNLKLPELTFFDKNGEGFEIPNLEDLLLPQFNLQFLNDYISRFKLDQIDFTDLTITLPDFSAALATFMPDSSLSTVSERIKNFLGIGEQGGGILGFFNKLYKDTFLSSPWPDMWNDKGVNNPVYFNPSSKIVVKIKAWAGSIQSLFTNLFNTAGTGWSEFSDDLLNLDLPDELTTGSTTTLRTPLGSLFDNIAKAWEKGRVELEAQIRAFDLAAVIGAVKNKTEIALQSLIDLFAIRLPVEVPQGIDAGLDSSEKILKRTSLGNLFANIARSWGLDQTTAIRATETWGGVLALSINSTKLALTQSLDSLKNLFKTEIKLPPGLDAGVDSGVYITPLGQVLNSLKEEYQSFLHSILTNDVGVAGGGFVVVDSPIGIAVKETKRFLKEQIIEAQKLKDQFLNLAFYKQEPVDFLGDPGMATTKSSSDLNDFATEVSNTYDRASDSLNRFRDSLINVFTVTKQVGFQGRETETSLANFSEIKENIEEIFIDIKISENAVKVIENLKELGVDRKASFQILFEDVTQAGADFVDAAFKAITSFDVEELQGAGFLASAFIAAFGVKNAVTFPIKIALIPAALSSEGAQEIAGSTAEGVGKLLRAMILPMSDGEADQDYVSAFISGLSKTLILIKDRFKEGLFGEDALEFSMPDELTTGASTTTTGSFKPDTFNGMATEMAKEFSATFGTALLAAIAAGMIFPAAAKAIKSAIIEKLNPFDDGNQMTKAINGSMNRQTQPVMARAQQRGQTMGARMGRGMVAGIKLAGIGFAIQQAAGLATSFMDQSTEEQQQNAKLLQGAGDIAAGIAYGAAGGSIFGPAGMAIGGVLGGFIAAGMSDAIEDPQFKAGLIRTTENIWETVTRSLGNLAESLGQLWSRISGSYGISETDSQEIAAATSQSSGPVRDTPIYASSGIPPEQQARIAEMRLNFNDESILPAILVQLGKVQAEILKNRAEVKVADQELTSTNDLMASLKNPFLPISEELQAIMDDTDLNAKSEELESTLIVLGEMAQKRADAAADAELALSVRETGLLDALKEMKKTFANEGVSGKLETNSDFSVFLKPILDAELKRFESVLDTLTDSGVKEDHTKLFGPESKAFADKLIEAIDKALVAKYGTGVKMATGGLVRGSGTETSDDIPAMLSNNEFVMNAKAVRKFGPNYLSRMNQGLMPIGLSYGDGVTSNVGIGPLEVRTGKSLVGFEREVKKLVGALSNSKDLLGGTADATRVIEAITNELEGGDPKLAGAIFNAYGRQVQEAIVSGLNDEDAGKLAGGVAQVQTDVAKKREEELRQVADNVQTTFASQLASGFKTGKFGNLLEGVLDQFTSSFIDLAVGNFSKSLFDNSGLSEGLFSAFDGADLFGGKLGGGLFKKKVEEGTKKASKDASGAMDEVASETGPLSSLWTSIKGIGEGLFEGIEGSLGGIFENGKKLLGGIFNTLMGSGGSGGLFSMITGSAFGSIFMSQGGIVPNTSSSVTGRDSVPAMLTPGELVLSTNQVRNLNSGSGGQQVINLSITGDISRQTKSEVIKMLPQIAAGVNANNKENNFRN